MGSRGFHRLVYFAQAVDSPSRIVCRDHSEGESSGVVTIKPRGSLPATLGLIDGERIASEMVLVTIWVPQPCSAPMAARSLLVDYFLQPMLARGQPADPRRWTSHVSRVRRRMNNVPVQLKLSSETVGKLSIPGTAAPHPWIDLMDRRLAASPLASAISALTPIPYPVFPSCLLANSHIARAATPVQLPC